jgi:uridine kinase
MSKYVAIDGKGGSGKTYLTNLLQEKLGAQVFHLDEYGNDYEPFIGIPQLITHIKNTDAQLVIFEGVGVFKDSFDEFEPFRILVEVPNEVRIERALSRDIPREDRSVEEWQKVFAIWDKAETEYFTDLQRRKANITVGEGGDFDLETITDEIKNWLHT